MPPLVDDFARRHNPAVRRGFILLAAIAGVTLGGCDPAVRRAQAAEKELAMTRASGSPEEQCAAAERARDAWLAAHDQHKYAMAQVEAFNTCFKVRNPDL